MKTKTAVLNGKPDAGNPHVRFDEGEVASEKPRRGSLLYKDCASCVMRRVSRQVVRAVFAAAVVAGFGNAWADIPASAYVQSGLVAQWDGIENAGLGQPHDPDAAYPKELVSGIAQTLTGTMAAGDNYFTLGAGYTTFKLPAMFAAINAGHATIEMYAGRNGTVAMMNNAGFVALGNSTRAFWAYQYNNYFIIASSIHAKASGEYQNLNFNDAGENTVSFLMGDSTATSEWRVNGVSKGTLDRKATDASENDDCYLGYIPGYEKARARMYSLRFYNRMLSAAEVAFNVNIDKIRFADANPATLTWPDGYRWNAEAGKIECAVRVAPGGAHGTVSVGGAELTADYEAWFELGRAHEVELLATPVEGYVFARWEGAGLTDAQRVSSSLTVAATHGLSLAAVFLPGLPAGAIPARAYVQNGLVGLWDGIENTVGAEGRTCHDDHAAAWVNLATGAATPLESIANDTWTDNAYRLGAATSRFRFAPNGLGGEWTVQFRMTDNSATMLDSENDWIWWKWGAGIKFDWRCSTRPTLSKWTQGETLTVASAPDWYGLHQPSAGWTKVENALSGKTYGNWVAVGRGGDGDSPTVGAKYYSIRVYDHALTDDEIALNAAIDRLRFDGVDPEEAGYRWNDETDKLEFRVVVRALEGGTLTIGDEQGVVAVTNWVTYGESFDITAQAVAQTGKHFCLWRGTGVPFDQMFNAQLSITATGAVDAQAVFLDEGVSTWTYDATAKTITRGSDGSSLRVTASGRNLTVNGTNVLYTTDLDLRGPIVDAAGNEYKIVSFADVAFTYNASNPTYANNIRLTSVRLPDTVTSIGYESFSGQSTLTSFWSSANLETYGTGAFQGCNGITEFVNLTPRSLKTVSGRALNTFGAVPLEFVIDKQWTTNYTSTIVGAQSFRSSSFRLIDLTGTEITTMSGTADICACRFLEELILPVTFANFPNNKDLIASCPQIRWIRFRGNPPGMGTADCFTSSCAGLALCAPKWNKRWEDYLSSAEQCTPTPLTEAQCKTWVTWHGDEPMPLVTCSLGNVTTARFVSYWYPDPPPQNEPVSYFDVFSYDKSEPVVSDGAKKLFDGTTFSCAKDHVTNAWVAAAGAEVTYAIPAAARTTRGLKVTGYRLHQLSMANGYANGRAPTAWKLYGRADAADEWTLLDSQEMMGTSDRRWAYFDTTDYGLEGETQVPPPLGQCALEYELPADRQGNYSEFKFEAIRSWNSENLALDETPIGLMELEFIGIVPTPAPDVKSAELAVRGWNDLSFDVTLASLGEQPALDQHATWAKVKAEVASDADFTEIVATSPVETLTAPGDVRLKVEGLSGKTAYFARVVAENDIGFPAEKQVGAVATLESPFDANAPVVATDEDGNVTVAFALTALYAPTADVEVWYAERPGAAGEKIADATVTAAGPVDFANLRPTRAGDSSYVRVVVTAGGETQSYGGTPRGYWMVEGTTLRHTQNGAVFNVTIASTTNVTLVSIADQNGVAEFDFTPTIYDADGTVYALVSVGTAFNSNKETTAVTLPETVTKIGNSAFYAAANLVKVRMSDRVTEIGESAFNDCKKLADISPCLPSGLVKIGNYAFNGCTALPKLTIGPNLATLSEYAFYGCTGLGEIVFPDAPVTVGNRVFQACSAISNIVPRLFPRGMSIGKGANSSFDGCVSLTGDAVFEIDGPLYLNQGTLSRAKISSLDFSRCTDVVFGGNDALGSMTAVTNIVFPVGFTNFSNRLCIPMAGPTRIQFLGAPPTMGATAPMSTTGKYLITVPNAGTRGDAWRQYLADNPDWTRPMTAAERTALKTQFPGVKGVKGMVNLGGLCGWHYLQRTPGDGFLIFVR